MTAQERGFQKWRERLTALSAALAYLGGIGLTGVALFTVAAVVGAATSSPLLGDSEVVEVVVGPVVVAFLPWCQMRGGHVAITIFTDRAPRGLRRGLDAAATALFAAVTLILTWRMGVGAVDAFSRDRISMFLQLPQWWGFAAAMPSMLLWSVAAAFLAAERLFAPAVAERALSTAPEADGP